MATPPLRATDRPETVLLPQRAEALLIELRTQLPTGLHKRVIDESIQKSILSVAHKLTVAMYQAALICDIRSDYFVLFREIDRHSLSDSRTLQATYKGCSYSMSNIHEYRLFLTFFIETFAATVFSLFDVCAHLINELYGFGLSERDISFKKVLEELKKKYADRSDAVYDLLRQYRTKDPTCRNWVEPLEGIRNRTTHRPITDICRFETQGDLYTADAPTDFFLNQNLLPSGTTNIKLCDFVQEVFAQLEQFIDDLYEQLRLGVERTGGLPIY